MSFSDELYPPVIERNIHGESFRVIDEREYLNTALYVREDIVDQIVKFHLFLQWFCNGDTDYWLNEIRVLKDDLEYDHQQDLNSVEQNARSDGYDEGYQFGYREGLEEGREQGYKLAKEESNASTY